MDSGLTRLGPGGWLVWHPPVLGPERLPAVTEVEYARAHPELAIITAVAHADAEPALAARVAATALTASLALGEPARVLSFDLVMAALGAAAREVLEQLMANHYEFQYAPMRASFNQGKAEGRTEGVAQTLLGLLERRFGTVGPAQRAQVEAAALPELQIWLDRILTETSIEAVLIEPRR